MLRKEGADADVSVNFYRAVIQAVFLFGEETWVLLAPMAQRLEGFHVGFLRQVKKLKSKRRKNGLWRKVAADKVLQGSGTQPLETYLDRRHETVAEWVTLQPIFKACVREKVYEGGRKLREPWWRNVAEEKQLRFTLKDISAAERERRQR